MLFLTRDVAFAQAGKTSAANAESGPSANGYTVALLRDAIPEADMALADETGQLLKRAGYEVTYLSCHDLCDPEILNTRNFRCLVLTSSPYFPNQAADAFHRFIRAGGDIVLMGGAAFREMLWQKGEAWQVSKKTDLPTGLSDTAAMEFDGAFEASEAYDLGQIRRIETWKDQAILKPGPPQSGDFSGVSALGFEFPGESGFFPVLSACDQYGRLRGWACGILANYAGPYKGSQWALFGIANPGYYRTASFKSTLVETLRLFASGTLPGIAQNRWAVQNRHVIADEPAVKPLPPLHIDRSGRHFWYPDGTRFFMVGANHFGSFDSRFWRNWNPALFEEDFRRAQAAGINCLRIYGGKKLFTDPEKLSALRRCANKYGVYVLAVVIDHTSDHYDKDKLLQQVREIVTPLKDETFLLGYDLQNEPYPWELAKIKADNMTLGEKWKHAETKAGFKEYAEAANLGLKEYFSTFYTVPNGLPPPANDVQKLGFAAVNGIIGDWVNWQVEEIRKIDPTHPVSVGYNTVYGLFPANQPLDFISHHCYQIPDSYAGVLANFTTYDRLRAAFPDRPVSLGEFGYSTGMSIGGRTLDGHNAALGEFLHYLYAHANGYEGAMKWALNDWPLALLLRYASWIPRSNMVKCLDQSRFGMYYYNGLPAGQPKPIAFALKFLSESLAAGLDSGVLKTYPAETLIGTGYEYRSANALFLGDIAQSRQDVSFKSTDGKPVNLLMRWSDTAITMMATHDAVVTLKPDCFVKGLPAGHCAVQGICGEPPRIDADTLGLLLLEGESVTIRKK